MKTIKKPFDLEWLKAHPDTKLETRDGREVTEWHYFETAMGYYPITIIVKGEKKLHTKEGRYVISEKENGLDLFMLVPCEEIVRYTNVYEHSFGETYNSITQAKEIAGKQATHIVKVTITEGQDPTFEIVHRYN